MKSAYIYPSSSRDKKQGLYNPYIDDLTNSLSRSLTFVNRDHPSRSGIFDILKYILKIDFIFFNWIEKLPENKGGRIQSMILFAMLPLLKMFNVKIVWTMHNKLSHSREHEFLKQKIFNKMLKDSDVILTHSYDGIHYGREFNKNCDNKILYLPHPVKDRRTIKQHDIQYDMLIWGTISPYKGIDKFLEFLKIQNLDQKYKILIIGKITSPDYADTLNQLASESIKIENKFIDDESLLMLIAQSKIVLFTYSNSSILSSGVLMDSLGYGANIVGPHVGAFADLAKDGIITTFQDFPDMIKKIDQQLEFTGNESQKEKLDLFLKANSWDQFAANLIKILE